MKKQLFTLFGVRYSETGNFCRHLSERSRRVVAATYINHDKTRRFLIIKTHFFFVLICLRVFVLFVFLFYVLPLLQKTRIGSLVGVKETPLA